jgi:hypothetical protein
MINYASTGRTIVLHDFGIQRMIEEIVATTHSTELAKDIILVLMLFDKDQV